MRSVLHRHLQAAGQNKQRASTVLLVKSKQAADPGHDRPGGLQEEARLAENLSQHTAIGRA